MAKKFIVKGEWHDEQIARVYTARAVTPTGRILAVVNIEVPLMVGVDLKDRFGAELIEEIERSAEEDASKIAAGT
mgnify:CR=1 FL=1